jgi:curved DNA-binding protein CbpA
MVLEVESGSSFQKIKQAYRKLAKRWHPDICGDAKAKDMMILINHAFQKAKRFC